LSAYAGLAAYHQSFASHGKNPIADIVRVNGTARPIRENEIIMPGKHREFLQGGQGINHPPALRFGSSSGF